MQINFNLHHLSILILFSISIALFNSAQYISADDNLPIAGSSPHQRPGDSRAELEIPLDLMSSICSKVGIDSGILGYTTAEMANFPGDKYCLRVVKNLFRDVEQVPRFSGRLSDVFMDSKDNLPLIATYCYSILDARPGYEFKELKEGEWGVDWIPAGTSPKDAIRLIFEHDGDDQLSKPVNMEYLKTWEQLPESIQRFVIRMMIGTAMASAQLRKAYDMNFLTKSLGVNNIDEIDRKRLYDLAISPWRDEEVPPASFYALDKIDLAYLAYGTIIYLNHMQNALTELKSKIPEIDFKNLKFESISFDTPSGKLIISGVGNNEINGNYVFALDLGGNDKYTGKTGVPESFENPISTVIDLDGNDIYDGGKEPSNLACGLFGTGMIIDLKGNDTYQCEQSGIGCGLYGTGIVADYDGDDKYTTNDAWGQGAAHAGWGMLIDYSGNDEYFCGTESQGFASTLGVGLILDIAGNDSYRVSDTVNVSEIFGNHQISFAQGTGYGRRADFGDGHSLAGGVGILVDGSGDDTYYGNIYAQGAGYWWSLGILEDKAGNDTYRCLQYSLGSAPHFAIGCMVDSKGNDKYNVGNNEAITQYQSSARDGSIAVFIDGDGDDEYLFRNMCAGLGDLNSIALFWDRYGNDIYHTILSPPYEKSPPMGTATTYERFRTFRDYMKSYGIFLDTSGTDIYEIDPNEYEGKKPLSVDNSEWLHNEGPLFWGYGLDVEWYIND